MSQNPYMDEAFCDTQVWIWDSCFMSLFTKYAREAFPGVETLNNFYEVLYGGKHLPKILPTENEPDWTGAIPGEPYEIKVHIADNPPLFAWAEYENAMMSGDTDYIKELLAEAKGQGLSDMLVGSKMRFIHSLDELEITERTIFKSPWSSSGRGVFSADSLDAPSIREKLTGFIKRQGGFIADKLYNKILDFALEYNISTGGEVTFLGFSVFVAGENGYYGYNIVTSQADLHDMIISKGCNEDMLNWLIETHRRLLHHGLAHKYSGPVGIDLLLANEGNGITIHPCIEINLRMNMGILAICVNNSGEDNRLLVPYRSNGFTAEVKEGRLIIGYNR
jgi:hypothetical protein